jgi:hypothetical protein
MKYLTAYVEEFALKASNGRLAQNVVKIGDFTVMRVSQMVPMILASTEHSSLLLPITRALALIRGSDGGLGEGMSQVYEKVDGAIEVILEGRAGLKRFEGVIDDYLGANSNSDRWHGNRTGATLLTWKAVDSLNKILEKSVSSVKIETVTSVVHKSIVCAALNYEFVAQQWSGFTSALAALLTSATCNKSFSSTPTAIQQILVDLGAKFTGPLSNRFCVDVFRKYILSSPSSFSVPLKEFLTNLAVKKDAPSSIVSYACDVLASLGGNISDKRAFATLVDCVTSTKSVTTESGLRDAISRAKCIGLMSRHSAALDDSLAAHCANLLIGAAPVKEASVLLSAVAGRIVTHADQAFQKRVLSRTVVEKQILAASTIVSFLHDGAGSEDTVAMGLIEECLESFFGVVTVAPKEVWSSQMAEKMLAAQLRFASASVSQQPLSEKRAGLLCLVCDFLLVLPATDSFDARKAIFTKLLSLDITDPSNYPVIVKAITSFMPFIMSINSEQQQACVDVIPVGLKAYFAWRMKTRCAAAIPGVFDWISNKVVEEGGAERALSSKSEGDKYRMLEKSGAGGGISVGLGGEGYRIGDLLVFGLSGRNKAKDAAKSIKEMLGGGERIERVVVAGSGIAVNLAPPPEKKQKVSN